MTALEKAAADFCAQLIDAHRQFVVKDTDLEERVRGLGEGVRLALGSLERAIITERQVGNDERSALYRVVDRTERKMNALLRAGGLNPEDFEHG